MAKIGEKLGLGAGTVLGGLQIGGQIMQSMINRGWQKQESDEQRKWQEKMWQWNNDYNTPANQRQRFQDAGYNPNLFYGQGSPGNAESAGSYQRADPKLDVNYDAMGMLGQYQTMQVQKAQVDSINANTAYQKQRTINAAVQEGTLKADQAIRMTESNIRQATQQYEIDKSRMTVENLKAQFGLTHNQIQKVAQEAKNLTFTEDLLRFQAELAEKGLTINDKFLVRLLQAAAEKEGSKFWQWLEDQKNEEYPNIKRELGKYQY